MAMDGFSVCALASEINQVLVGSKVDKIQQTEHDELLISFFGPCGGKKLRLTANAAVSRVCFTEDRKQSPKTAPMFCMLLRKHLSGAKLISVTQPDFERILVLTFEGFDELGDLSQKHLIAELMGRHSNIILTEESGRIIDSIKHIDFSVSSVRQILPGMTYQSPPPQEKKNPLACDLRDILMELQAATGNEKVDKVMMQLFRGVSPLVSREIAYRAFEKTDIYINELDYSGLLEFATTANEVFKIAKEKNFSPCYLVRNDTGKPFEFCPMEILQYGDAVNFIKTETMSMAVESFYREKDKKERIAFKSARLVKVVSNNIERCAKKLNLQTAELDDTKNMEKFQKYGELITANLYRISQGEKAVMVEDYYEADCPTITIPLDTRITPAENAQKYFKKYAKAKTAKKVLTEQIEKAKAELSYLESVSESLALAETAEDLSEIGEELFEQGYLKRTDGSKKKKTLSKPMEFQTSDGFTVLVGKNNRQNDLLTLKTSKNADLWFHTKDIHGSHVVLCYEHGKEFTDTAILEAARLAAKYSKAKHSENVPVDYTLIKYVKKPSGAAPGKVIYTNQNTVYVTPKGE